MDKRIEELLIGVKRPAQYIGGEWNSPKKGFESARLRFGICFPDLYEVGMSNLGVRIIYNMLNSMDGVSCERFFAPDIDMEEALRGKGLGLYSVDSCRPMGEFDIIGFSLGHELSYTNMLNMLSLGGVPLESSARNDGHPLIIAGGPCVMNPEPISDFVDAFVLGEAEEVLIEIIDVYSGLKARSKARYVDRKELMLALSSIEGVYIPSFYEFRFAETGKIKEISELVPGAPKLIKKRFVRDFNGLGISRDWLVPYVQLVHDRITLEVMRGCPNKCRFCQARSQYFPFRQRDAEKVLSAAKGLYKNTGYEEVSLCGLSMSDYTYIIELMEGMIGFFREKGVGVSLPSIKPRIVVGELSKLMSSIRKTGLTFAPEAATERLRKVLNKDFSEEDLIEVMERAYSQGYRHVKLYFMIGLPGEEESDLAQIIAMSERISRLKKKVAGGSAQVNISVNSLIPKPHTSFQWLAMEDTQRLKAKQDFIKGASGNAKLNISFHHLYMSFLEGIFSRGDRRLGRVIKEAFIKGARFDSWSNCLKSDVWEAAFAGSGVDPAFYLRRIDKDEILPWDMLDTGISKELLLKEALDCGV